MKKRQSAEQVVRLLRQADVALGRGINVSDVCRRLGTVLSRTPCLTLCYLRLSRPLLDIDLKRPECLLMPSHRMAESVRESLRREEVDDDPLRELDRLWACATDLLVEPEVDDQFFRSSRDAAEIGIRAGDMGFIDRNLNGFRACGLFVGHGELQM